MLTRLWTAFLVVLLGFGIAAVAVHKPAGSTNADQIQLPGRPAITHPTAAATAVTVETAGPNISRISRVVRRGVRR